MSNDYFDFTSKLVADAPTYVDALTPIKKGASMDHLYDALASALKSLGHDFQWFFACHPEDIREVHVLIGEVQEATDYTLAARGFTTTSANVASTRNQLLAQGRGDYVIQLDADDLWVPGSLAMLKWQLDRNPKIAAAHGKHLKVDPAGDLVVEEPPAWRFTFPGEVAQPGDLALRREDVTQAGREFTRDPDYIAVYPIHPSAGLYRRSVVEEVGGWDEALGNYFEDSVLMAKVQHKHSWHVTTAPVMLYRTLQPDSLSQQNPGRRAWKVLDEIAKAHEAGFPRTAPRVPFPTPRAETLVPAS